MSKRDNGKKTIYSSRADVRETPGIYKSGDGDKRRQLRNGKRKKRQQQLRIVGTVAIALVLIFSIMLLTRKNAVNIFVGDYYVGQLKDTKITEEDFINAVTAQISGESGNAVQINEEIRFESVRAKKSDIVTKDYALSEVKRLVTYKIEATVIVIDGSGFIALYDANETQKLFDDIIAEYLPEDVSNIAESGFVENVSTELKFVDFEEIVSYEEAWEKLTYGSSTAGTYTIASGDSLSLIASKNDTTIEEILEMNPGMTISTPLRIGDELNVKVLVPFLSVKTVENVIFTEKETKEIETRTDNTKPATYKKVIQQGKDGQKEVTTQIIRINGFETEQKVVSEKITVEPVKEIIMVGTK